MRNVTEVTTTLRVNDATDGIRRDHNFRAGNFANFGKSASRSNNSKFIVIVVELIAEGREEKGERL